MIATILAQIAENQQTLYTYGPMGIVLAWFMWRGEKLVGEIRTLAHRIDGLTRALMMDMVSRDSCGDNTRSQARQEIAKIEDRMRRSD